jgi:hypothetical protein
MDLISDSRCVDFRCTNYRFQIFKLPIQFAHLKSEIYTSEINLNLLSENIFGIILDILIESDLYLSNSNKNKCETFPHIPNHSAADKHSLWMPSNTGV